MKKIIKLKLSQVTANYKTAFSQKIKETYPLPPYSSVIGLFHSILNYGEKETRYFESRISIQGKSMSLFNDFQTMRLYKYFDTKTGMPKINTTPLNVQILHNVELLIHIELDEDIAELLIEKLKNGNTPKLYLGRSEDLVNIEEISVVSLQEFKLTDNPQKLKYDAYIPFEIINKTNERLCETTRTFDKYTPYVLNTRYTIKKGIREFKEKDVMFVKKDNSPYFGFIDEESDGDIFYTQKDSAGDLVFLTEI